MTAEQEGNDKSQKSSDFNEEQKDEGTKEPKAPRRGSTLEGRVRSLLQNRGYQAETNKIVLDNEFDVWAQDGEGQLAVAECKEHYKSGPATPKMVRNFFGKTYDVAQNFGEDVYVSLFVSISGFTEAARSLCDRLEIVPVDSEKLEFYEKSEQDITPPQRPLEDETIMNLRKQRDELREKLNRRKLIRNLSQQIENYENKLMTSTMPGFLVPSSTSSSFWYSEASETPIVGLNGEFQDFIAPNFPYVAYLAYTQSRFLGQSTNFIRTSHIFMKEGVIRTNEDKTLNNSPDVKKPKLKQLMDRGVITTDGTRVGKVLDMLISVDERTKVSVLMVELSEKFSSSIDANQVSLPADRTSVKLMENGKIQLTLHADLAEDWG